MNDRSKPYNGITRQIVPIELSEQEQKKYFPTGNVGLPYEDFMMLIDGEIYGYVQLDYPDPMYSGIHLYVHPECRNAEAFEELTIGFVEVVLPYLKSKGIQYIAGTCAVDDTKVQRIFDTFGFDTKVVGTLKI